MAKKLSKLVELYVNQELDEYSKSTMARLSAGYPRVLAPISMPMKKEIRQEAWFLILDELSEELLKLAGNGLPIQGQRRILDRLGIPRDKAE